MMNSDLDGTSTICLDPQDIAYLNLPVCSELETFSNKLVASSPVHLYNSLGTVTCTNSQ